MLNILKNIYFEIKSSTILSLKKKIIFIKEYYLFSAMLKQNNYGILKWKERNPQLEDKTGLTSFDSHYIYHPAWAARILAQIKPRKHIDIASSLAFSATISAFIRTDFYDYRPAKLYLDNLKSEHADLLKLPFMTNSIESCSCMHVVEHIGLGRYGDPIDIYGDIKAINELKRVLAPKGDLLFVVPIGQPKIVFNAHRIYGYDQIVELFAGFELVEFALVPDDSSKSGLIRNSTKEMADKQAYGCGCFWFRKLDLAN